MTSDDYSTKPIGSWKPLWRWKVFDGLYLCKSLRYDLSDCDWMERWLKLPLFFFFFLKSFNGGPLFQFGEQEWWVRAQGLFCSSFRKIAVLYLRIFISVFFLVSPRGSEKKKRKKGGGEGDMELDISTLSFNALFPFFFFFFFSFLTGFERKYLTKGAFVCFQMIDFGIWATPLAVQG